MKFGLSQSTLERLTSVFIDFPEVESLVISGSRAKGNYKPGSDIDLILLGASLSQRQCDVIAEKIDALLLPYLIDLSVFSTLNQTELETHIERVGKEFYRCLVDNATRSIFGTFTEHLEINSVSALINLQILSTNR